MGVGISFTQRLVVQWVIILIWLSGNPELLLAGQNVWTAIGPETVWIENIAVDPHSPQTIYVVADKLYKVTGNGEQWALLVERVTRSNLVFDPQNPNQWALLAERVTRSNLVFDPQNPQVLYMPGQISKDGGRTWEELTAPNGLEILIDEQNYSKITLYAYDSIALQLHKSEDGGKTWVSIDVKFPGLSAGWRRGIVSDPRNPQVLYVWSNVYNFYSSDYYYYRSINAGKDWTKLNIPTTGRSPLAVDPQNPQIIYIGITNGVLKSVDGGQSWTTIDLSDVTVRRILIHPRDTQILYAGVVWEDGVRAGMRVLKSVDSGKTWREISRNNSILLTIDPQNPQIVYGVREGNVLKFSAVEDPVIISLPRIYSSTLAINSILVDPTNSQLIYVGAFRYGAGYLLYKTQDGEKNWDVEKEFYTPVYPLVFDPLNPEILYISGNIEKGLKEYSVFKVYRGNYTEAYFGYLGEDNQVEQMIFHPRNPKIAFSLNWLKLFIVHDAG